MTTYNEMTMMMTMIVILFLSLSCSWYADTEHNSPITSTPDQSETISKDNTKLVINSIEFYAWWWGEDQLKTGFDEKNPPPKESYTKLERWKDTSDLKVPHPEVFDVVCKIENKGDRPAQDGDLIILTTIDFIIAPTYLYGGDINKILNGVTWGRVVTMDDVKMEIVPYLKSNESAQIKFKDFNLGTIIKQFPDEDNVLWPWALRVNIHVMNRDMTRVAQGHAILTIFPSDDKLKTR